MLPFDQCGCRGGSYGLTTTDGSPGPIAGSIDLSGSATTTAQAPVPPNPMHFILIALVVFLLLKG